MHKYTKVIILFCVILAAQIEAKSPRVFEEMDAGKSVAARNEMESRLSRAAEVSERSRIVLIDVKALLRAERARTQPVPFDTGFHPEAVTINLFNDVEFEISELVRKPKASDLTTSVSYEVRSPSLTDIAILANPRLVVDGNQVTIDNVLLNGKMYKVFPLPKMNNTAGASRVVPHLVLEIDLLRPESKEVFGFHESVWTEEDSSRMRRLMDERNANPRANYENYKAYLIKEGYRGEALEVKLKDQRIRSGLEHPIQGGTPDE